MAVKVPVYKLMGREKELVGYALVDDQDEELVAGRTWYASTSYASSQGVLMHRMLMGARAGEAVHHRNHDRLDNRRENLEVFPSNGVHRKARHGGRRFQKVMTPEEFLARDYRQR